MKVKIFGIYFNIEILFLIVFLVFLLSPTFYKYFFNFYISYLFIAFHELSHIFVASMFSRKIYMINFSLFGLNVSFLENYKLKENYLNNIIIFLAGPVANLILAIIFYNVHFIFEINIFLAFLNLLPIKPLDGYNIFKNILLFFNFDNKTTLSLIKSINNIILVVFFLTSIYVYIKLKNINILIFTLCIFLLQRLKEKQ